MAQQFIRATVDDSVLEPDAMRGTEHYLTQEIRNPFTGETQDRAEVVNYEQQRRDAMREAIDNRGPFVFNAPTVVGQQSPSIQDTYKANPDTQSPTPAPANPTPTYVENRDESAAMQTNNSQELDNTETTNE
jgi:hypothetical protein